MDGALILRRAPRPSCAVVAALLVVSSTGCGAGGPTERAAAQSEPTTTTAAVVTTSSSTTTSTPAASPAASPGCLAAPGDRVTAGWIGVESSGRRRALVALPPGASADPPTPAPLVVDLHGYTGTAEGQTSVDELGARGSAAGMVVVTPQALGELTLWNATEVSGLADDVGFISTLIERMLRTACIDTTRVAVVGGSNGAFMASTVGCRLADRVTAIAAVAGLLLPDGCHPSAPVSVLAMHGSEDHLVSIDGGLGPDRVNLELNAASRAVFGRLPVVAVPTAAAGWAWLAGCTGEPRHGTPAPLVERTSWDRCHEGAEVRLDVVEHAGHAWLGSNALRMLGASDGSPELAEDATGEILEFVEAHPRRV